MMNRMALWSFNNTLEDYGYDANGNRNTDGNAVQSTGDNRQSTDASGNTYTYDAEGNQITKTDASGNETDYAWDQRDRLTEVKFFTGGSSSGTLTKTVDYVYDAFNRLVKETVTVPAVGGGSTVTQEAFAYDGTNIVLQFEQAGTGAIAASNLSDRYLWGPAVDQILADEQVASLTSASAVLWGLADQEGTIRDIVNNSGAVVDHRVFDGFGNVTSESGSEDFIFAYDGQQLDKATGLYIGNGQPYDPAIGRFISQGISGVTFDVNPYCFAENNPTKLTFNGRARRGHCGGRCQPVRESWDRGHSSIKAIL